MAYSFATALANPSLTKTVAMKPSRLALLPSTLLHCAPLRTITHLGQRRLAISRTSTLPHHTKCDFLKHWRQDPPLVIPLALQGYRQGQRRCRRVCVQGQQFRRL